MTDNAKATLPPDVEAASEKFMAWLQDVLLMQPSFAAEIAKGFVTHCRTVAVEHTFSGWEDAAKQWEKAADKWRVRAEKAESELTQLRQSGVPTTVEEAMKVIDAWRYTDSLGKGLDKIAAAAEIDKLRQRPLPDNLLSLADRIVEVFGQSNDPQESAICNHAREVIAKGGRPLSVPASGMTPAELQQAFKQWLIGYDGCALTMPKVESIAVQVGKLLTQTVTEAVAAKQAEHDLDIKRMEAGMNLECDAFELHEKNLKEAHAKELQEAVAAERERMQLEIDRVVNEYAETYAQQARSHAAELAQERTNFAERIRLTENDRERAAAKARQAAYEEAFKAMQDNFVQRNLNNGADLIAKFGRNFIRQLAAAEKPEPDYETSLEDSARLPPEADPKGLDLLERFGVPTEDLYPRYPHCDCGMTRTDRRPFRFEVTM